MEVSRLFFGKESLKDYVYYYYLPRLSFQSKKELSDKIFQYEGKTTFSLSTHCVVIIECFEDFQSKEFKETIRDFGDISLYHDNEVFPIKHNTSITESKLLAIMLSAINHYEKEKMLFQTMINHGLPKHAVKENLIAVLMPYEIESNTHFHQFPLLTNDMVKYGKSKYDIPMYMPNITGGYSAFSTIAEKDVIIDYLKKETFDKSNDANEGQPKEEFNDIKSIINSKFKHNKRKRKEILKTPIPALDHTYCHLCKKKYKEYESHLKGTLHIETITKNENAYKQLSNTFDRINTYWKLKNKQEIPGAEQSNTNSVIKEKTEDEGTSKINDHLIIQQADTPPTQYDTIISGPLINNDIKEIQKAKSKYGKRKYCEMLDLNLGNITYNSHRRSMREDPRLRNKMTKWAKKYKA